MVFRLFLLVIVVFATGYLCGFQTSDMWYRSRRRSYGTPVLWNHLSYMLKTRDFSELSELRDHIGSAFVAEWQKLDRLWQVIVLTLIVLVLLLIDPLLVVVLIVVTIFVGYVYYYASQKDKAEDDFFDKIAPDEANTPSDELTAQEK